MMRILFDRRFLTSVALLLSVAVTLTSCDPLRKKFTRKKKESAESIDFQPVLEPQDYPAPEHDPALLYKQHYSLIKVWYKDLWSGIDERMSDGMVKYGLKQISGQIEEMKALLKPDRAAGLEKLNNLLAYYRTSLEQQRSFRNYSRIQSDLRAFDRMLRGDYRFDKVKEDLASP